MSDHSFDVSCTLNGLLDAVSKCAGQDEDGAADDFNPSAALQFAQAFSLIATAIGEKNLSRVFFR